MESSSRSGFCWVWKIDFYPCSLMTGKSLLAVGRKPLLLSTWPSVGLLKCFHNTHLTSSKASSPRKGKEEAALSFITKWQKEIVHLLPPYLIGNTDSHSSAWRRATERRKNQEVKIMGDHLESWPLRLFSVLWLLLFISWQMEVEIHFGALTFIFFIFCEIIIQ